MARISGTRSSLNAAVGAFGAWLHPVSALRRRSALERQLQFRAGIVGLFCLVTGLVALATAVWDITVTGRALLPAGPTITSALMVSALALVFLSVFAPQAVFRTRSAALTKLVLSNPSAPIRPWQSTTITFDAVLVGAMLAGLYLGAALALAFFGLAFALRVLIDTRRNLEADPNTRFHSLVTAWASAATGAGAYLIVSPLSASVSTQGAIAPLIFAGLVAMYLGLVFNSVERWVNDDRTRWAFARDAVDTRRIVVALVSAGIVWAVSFVGETVSDLYSVNADLAGTLTGLGIFLASWLLLWFVSIRLWRRDAVRTLAMWGAHQSEIVSRLADGSLSPELAARAAMRTTTRMAVSVFGATRAMAIVDDGHGHVTTHLVAVDRFDNAPAADARTLATLPHLRLPLYPVPGHANTSSVTIAGWLRIGSFMTRSRTIVNRFTELATTTLLTPVVAADDDRIATAFDTMFDDISRWPTLTAFEQAVDRMRERADHNPHTDSLLIGAYAIDEFGALAGGRFEQAAVAQVLRLALGHQDFAGHDLFVAYEAPGRLWVALGGGPIIRNGIALLRGLQQQINDHGAVPSAKLDVDVHVSVSFGYAAHQVDEFTREGLMAMALNRLAIDQSSRDPFSIDNLLSYDIRPEDIIGEPDVPVTAVDVLDLLAADRLSTTSAGVFATHFTLIADADTGSAEAVLATIGWHRSFGSLDLSDPAAFQTLVNRQPRLAAEATRIALEKLKLVFAEADHLSHDTLPIVVALPSILLGPDAGEYALPNLVTPFLDRRDCARTVILVDTVPVGGGQALRLLSDRGLQIAVTAAAAAGADPGDLFGWQRWGILFPQHVIQGPNGIDGLTIQQTVSAIATHGTRLIGIADQRVDPRDLAAHNIDWTIEPGQSCESVRESFDSAAPRAT